MNHFERNPKCACELCERAAILEYCGGFSRADAERMAAAHVKAKREAK